MEEFGSSSGKGVGEIEVERVSHSVSHAEATAAPSPSHVANSEFGPVGSPSRSEVEQVNSLSGLEVETLSRDASPASLI